MAGIAAYGAYVPYYRLQRAAIGAALGAGGGKGTRAVASYDEDATSMGVEAARIAMKAANGIAPQAVFFATSTPPYLDKTNAAAIHAALGIARVDRCVRPHRVAAVGGRRAADGQHVTGSGADRAGRRPHGPTRRCRRARRGRRRGRVPLHRHDVRRPSPRRGRRPRHRDRRVPRPLAAARRRCLPRLGRALRRARLRTPRGDRDQRRPEDGRRDSQRARLRDRERAPRPSRQASRRFDRGATRGDRRRSHERDRQSRRRAVRHRARRRPRPSRAEPDHPVGEPLRRRRRRRPAHHRRARRLPEPPRQHRRASRSPPGATTSATRPTSHGVASCSASHRDVPIPNAPRPRRHCGPSRGSTGSSDRSARHAVPDTCRPPASACGVARSIKRSPNGSPTSPRRSPRTQSTGWRSRCRRP